MSDRFEQLRSLALEVAIALMLISGITPLAGITNSVEHLPYGIAVAMLLGKRPPKPFVICVALATVFWTLSHFYWSAWDNWVYLVQFTNVLTPLVFFTTLRPKLERTAHIVFWVYIGFGLLQWFRLLDVLTPLFENLLPRFRNGRENGFRGVASLESEPARAGFQILMLYVIGQARFHNRWVGLVALLATQVLLFRATIGLMLTVVFVGFLAIAEVRKRPKLLPVLLVGAATLCVGAFVVNPKVEVIVETTVDEGLSGLNETLVATSGGRFLALQDAVVDIVKQPFGYGADPSYGGDNLELVEEGYYEASDGRGYRIERAARPVSAILNAVRTFGVAIAFLFAWAVRSELFAGRRPALNAYFWFVVFSALFYGPSGSEALLIALGVAGQPTGSSVTEHPDGDMAELSLE